MSYSSSYLAETLSPASRRDTVRRVVRAIKKSKIEFDAIAFRGMSGALIAPLVADKLDKSVILVRKKEDNTHSSYKIETDNEKITRYIIVDDLISSGATMREIRKQIALEGACFRKTDCVGVFLYSETWARINGNVKFPPVQRKLPRKQTVEIIKPEITVPLRVCWHSSSKRDETCYIPREFV